VAGLGAASAESFGAFGVLPRISIDKVFEFNNRKLDKNGSYIV